MAKSRGSKDVVTKRQRLEILKSQLWADRSSFDAHWRELAEYMSPRRTRWTVTDRNKGDRRSQKIIDSTGLLASRTLQSGLHAGLTSPARPWMRLTTPDPSLAEVPGVKNWLHLTTQRMLTVFARTNLYNALPTVYGDIGIFGTAAVAVLEDDRDLLRCYPQPLGSYAFAVDSRGRPVAFVRELEYSVRQMIELFGRQDGETEINWQRFSPQVKNLYDNGRLDTGVTVLWFITPNDEQDPEALEAYRAFPFYECYVEAGRDSVGGLFLKEGGYREFPIMCPRWDVTAEDTYGTNAPGIIALSDVKGLQILAKRKALAIEKQINPPLQAPTAHMTQKTSMLPGDITFVEGPEGLRPLHDVTASIAEMMQDVGEHQFRIRRAFYEDLFLMLQNSQRLGQPVTAREIEERHEEKLLALGPVLERTNDELLDPLVDRVFAMMIRAELVPPPPAELEGVDLRVEYISVLAQAQKSVSVLAADRFFQSVIALSDRFPEVLHKVDAMQAVDDYGEMLGVNPSLIRSDDEALKRVQAIQQAQAAAMQAEAENLRAQTAKTMAETPMGNDSTLLRETVGAGV